MWLKKNWQLELSRATTPRIISASERSSELTATAAVARMSSNSKYSLMTFTYVCLLIWAHRQKKKVHGLLYVGVVN